MPHVPIRFLLITAALIAAPTTAYAHGTGGSLYGRYTDRIEREIRPIIVRQLKRHNLYTRDRVARILNIGWHESRWRIGTRRIGCVGPLQFDQGWTIGQNKRYWAKHDIRGPWKRDGRLSYEWSIHRIVHVYRDGGVAKVKEKWKATYGR